MKQNKDELQTVLQSIVQWVFFHYFRSNLITKFKVFLSLIKGNEGHNGCSMYLFLRIPVLTQIYSVRDFFSHEKHRLKSVRIRSYSGPYFLVSMREKTDQNNFEYGLLLRSEKVMWKFGKSNFLFSFLLIKFWRQIETIP